MITEGEGPFEATMATRSERLAQFVTDREPEHGVPLEILSEDYRGTYVMPFACIRTEDGWRNAQTGDLIEVDVLGWREFERKEKGGQAAF
jgi:hypothetical protein